jgi:multidrug transporter EmrE-like cation transporter
MNSVSVILAVLSVLLSAIGQLFLKVGAGSRSGLGWIPPVLHPYLNRYTIPGYGFLFIVTFLSVYILQGMPLKFFFPLFISGNLIAITIFSRIFLHESFTPQKILGISIIVSGLVFFFL